MINEEICIQHYFGIIGGAISGKNYDLQCQKCGHYVRYVPKDKLNNYKFNNKFYGIQDIMPKHLRDF
jgi:hypothetical protein